MKTYSNRSNATRAAKKAIAGTENSFSVFSTEDNRWGFLIEEPKAADAPVTVKAATPHVNGEAIPAESDALGDMVTVSERLDAVAATPEAPKPTTQRGGGRKFMQGKHVRRSYYREATIGETIFEICDRLAAELGNHGVPFRSHVEELCVRAGIKPSTARAGYTQWKQVHKLDVRTGRPTAEDDALFEEIQAKVMKGLL